MRPEAVMVASHRWRMMLRATALSTLCLAAGCATQATLDARLRALQPQLVARDDPDSLATAAFFERWTTGQWQDAQQLAARAAAAAPLRPDLAFMRLQLCYQIASCNPEPLEAQLRQLDSDNGISWLYALARAQNLKDQPGIAAALEGLARSQRIGIYWTDLVAHMTAALTASPGIDVNDAFIAVIGLDAAMAIPSLKAISDHCNKEQIVNAELLERCRRISAAFEHADTVLLASYGIRLAARLWPDGSAQRVRIDSARRAADYRMILWTRNAQQLDSSAATRTLAMLYPRYPTEQEALEAWYVQLHLNPNPPADWIDQ